MSFLSRERLRQTGFPYRVERPVPGDLENDPSPLGRFLVWLDPGRSDSHTRILSSVCDLYSNARPLSMGFCVTPTRTFSFDILGVRGLSSEENGPIWTHLDVPRVVV